MAGIKRTASVMLCTEACRNQCHCSAKHEVAMRALTNDRKWWPNFFFPCFSQ